MRSVLAKRPSKRSAAFWIVPENDARQCSLIAPALPVKFLSTADPDLTVEFILDTGFTGFLASPIEIVEKLNFPFLHKIPAQLADGSFIEVAVHVGNILWLDAELEVRILATGERPLLGTALLDGCEMIVQFREEGSVALIAL